LNKLTPKLHTLDRRIVCRSTVWRYGQVVKSLFRVPSVTGVSRDLSWDGTTRRITLPRSGLGSNNTAYGGIPGQRPSSASLVPRPGRRVKLLSSWRSRAVYTGHNRGRLKWQSRVRAYA